MERLSDPQNSQDPLLAVIPIYINRGRYYTLEARMFAGNDQRGGIPGEAVVIHEVDDYRNWKPSVSGSWGRRAQVVDVDHNGNPNDAGAMWMPGKIFTDPTNRIAVKILERDDSGFRIRIEIQQGAEL